MPVRFGRFALDEATRQLSCGAEPIHVSPKAFDLLAFLIRHRPAARSKGDIHQHLWPETFVTDGNVAVLIAEIRRALGDDGQHQTFIRTVPRFGYAFAGAAIESPGAAHDAAPCWLAWDAERLPLAHGENIVGRDALAGIRIDAVGVSRRHARVVVDGHGVQLEDLASKNGTYADGARVISPVTLVDGMEVRFGPVALRFRQPAGAGSTLTILPHPPPEALT